MKNIFIIGCGLLGSSLLRKIHKKKIAKKIFIFEKSKKNIFKIKKINFDIFLLGMGNDGHVVSIFPNSEELKQKFISKSVFRKDFKRITLGLNIINNSKKIFLWLSNKEKTRIYKKYAHQGKGIPVNNLNKKKLYCFSIN